jgi:ADP-heptose:LPS heptosyltransferase
MTTETARNPTASAPKRLFILRPDHLGDLVLFTGALREIRRAWPETHVTLCVRGFGRQLYAVCPYVDTLFPYEQLRKGSPINWIPYFPGARRVRQALQEIFGGVLRAVAPPAFLPGLACDMAVLPPRSPEEEYHWLMRMVPAATRLGVRGNLANQSARADRISRPFYSRQIDASSLPADYPEFEMTRDFLRFMGVEAGDLWPEFWTTDADKQAAEKLIAPAPGRRILGIAPGNTYVGKKLPPHWYSSMFKALKGEALDIILLGSPVDMEDCLGAEQALRGAGAASVRNLAGKTSVREMIECLRLCDVILAQETAALHMATGLRKPVVAIIGGGHYGRFYPWGDPKLARVATNKMDCFGCNWACKYESMRCIQEVAPEFVAGELADLLAGTAAVGR